MKATTATLLSWSVALGLLSGAARLWTTPTVELIASDMITDSTLPLVQSRAGWEEAERTLASGNPFRIDRRFAIAGQDHSGLSNDGESAEPDFNIGGAEALIVVGLIGGPPWLVLIEGLAGHEDGTLVPLGEEVGGIRVVGIRGDTVVIVMADGTHELTLNRMWR